jgi:F420-dependent oxidoreductase-like protein
VNLDYHIMRFDWAGGPPRIGPGVADLAERAEAMGVRTVSFMDHFFQMDWMAPAEDPMLEGYTALGFVAGRTERVRMRLLVTGVTYRHPGILAKAVTTLDVVSGGRAELGIGAAGYQLEHDALGFEFGTVGDRFERLEEALQIILPMLRGKRPTVQGRHYTVTDAINEPPPISRIPVMIGGGGERKTLRLVAQYADESNLIANLAEVPRKLDALAAHCERLGRDRSEITVTLQRMFCVAPTHEQAEAEVARYLGERGLDLATTTDATGRPIDSLFTLGDPDEVGEQLAGLLELGIDGFTCKLAANGYDPDRIALFGETASKVLR